MFVRASDFDPSMTQSQVDDIINSLAVNAYDFSQIACLDGRMYGVKTKCEQCSLEINYCVRNALSRILHSTQQKVEREVGYDISPQYHYARIPFGYSGKVQLPHRNIELVNVQQSYEVLAGYENLTVSPYIQENITIQEINGKCFAIFSATLVENPNKAIIRDENGRIYEHQQVSGYPKRVGGNWQVPIMGISSPCTTDLTFNVQHCELIRVSVATPTCTGTVYPVYPDSHQIIPTFKTEVSGGNTIFWFHVWALARPEFMDEGIDFASGDFYKLYDTIDLMCFRDTTKNATVTVVKSENCELVYATSDTVPSVTILDGEIGLVYVDTKLFKCNGCNIPLWQCDGKYPQYLNIWYKTNPSVMRQPFPISSIREAITYYVGAELPTSACACTVTEGFIFNAQSAIAKSEYNPFTGTTNVSMDEYRDVKGRIRYKEIMYGVKKYVSYGRV